MVGLLSFRFCFLGCLCCVSWFEAKRKLVVWGCVCVCVYVLGRYTYLRYAAVWSWVVQWGGRQEEGRKERGKWRSLRDNKTDK